MARLLGVRADVLRDRRLLVKRLLMALTLVGVLTLPMAGVVLADAQAPTNGGSANGNGSSGQCTGDQASRPPSCHNGLGSGN